MEKSNHIIDELVAGRTVPDVPEPLLGVFRPSVQPYTISNFKYEPVKEIAALEIPVMIIQGTTDLQITVKDAQLLAAANESAQLRIIDEMNHVLKHTTATTLPEQQSSYTDPSLPLAPDLLDEITRFLAQTLKD